MRDYWEVAKSFKNEGVLLTSFVLKIKCDEKKRFETKKHLVMCGNEEVKYKENALSYGPLFCNKADSLIVQLAKMESAVH